MSRNDASIAILEETIEDVICLLFSVCLCSKLVAHERGCEFDTNSWVRSVNNLSICGCKGGGIPKLL